MKRYANVNFRKVDENVRGISRFLSKPIEMNREQYENREMKRNPLPELIYLLKHLGHLPDSLFTFLISTWFASIRALLNSLERALPAIYTAQFYLQSKLVE